jgi:hypothetical protein
MMQITIDKLPAMKLVGMAEFLEELINSASYEDLNFEERFGMRVDKEMTFRENQHFSMLLRRARFRYAGVDGNKTI